MDLLTLVITISIAALLFAGFLARHLMKKDTGSASMREVSNAIKVGAEAFVRRQYATIAILTAVLAAAIFLAYALFGNYELGWRTSVSCLS